MLQRVATQGIRPRSGILAVWALWLLAIFLMALLKPFSQSSSGFEDIVVLAHMAASLVALIVIYPQRIAALLATSLALRTALVFWDLKFTHIWRNIHSGADTETFYAWSVMISDDLSLLSNDVRGGFFSKIFGLLFHFTGPTRVFAQYTIALFGLTITLIVYKILREIRPGEQTTLGITALAALLPNTLLLSTVFLRESLVGMLVAGSALYFTRWFREGAPWRIVVAVLFILAASVFHSGVVAVALGYIFVALFYKRGQHRFRFGLQSLPYLAVFAAIATFAVFRYPDLFLGKFDQVESGEDLFEVANFRWGGSTYLPNLVVQSFSDLLLYGPLRGLYFLGSPMPWDFRGFADLLTFTLDSLLYLGALYYAARNYPQLRDQRTFVVALLVPTLIATLVFGAGVGNAGTAIRHRYKLVSLFLLLLASTINQRTADDPRSHKALRFVGRSTRTSPPHRLPTGSADAL